MTRRRGNEEISPNATSSSWANGRKDACHRPAAATAGFFDGCPDRPNAVLLLGCTRIDEAPPSNVSRARVKFLLYLSCFCHRRRAELACKLTLFSTLAKKLELASASGAFSCLRRLGFAFGPTQRLVLCIANHFIYTQLLFLDVSGNADSRS